MPLGNRKIGWSDFCLAFGLLALGGWFLDSVLMGIQMHGFPDVGWRAHLSHLWYGPLLLAAGLFVAQRYLPRTVPWLEKPLAFAALTHALRPEVKTLATYAAASETKAALLAFFHRYKCMTIAATALAFYLDGEQTEVERALVDLVALGLVESQSACDLTFYRLAKDKRQVALLDELVAWQDHWFQRGRQLAQTVGYSPMLRREQGFGNGRTTGATRVQYKPD